jgi:hypothetical protein
VLADHVAVADRCQQYGDQRNHVRRGDVLQAVSRHHAERIQQRHGLDISQSNDDDLPQDKCLLEFGDSTGIMMGGQFTLPLKESRSGELGRLRLGALRKLSHMQLVVGKAVCTVIWHKKWPLWACFFHRISRLSAGIVDRNRDIAT